MVLDKSVLMQTWWCALLATEIGQHCSEFRCEAPPSTCADAYLPMVIDDLSYAIRELEPQCLRNWLQIPAQGQMRYTAACQQVCCRSSC